MNRGALYCIRAAPPQAGGRAGVLYLPALGPTRVEMILAMLLLAVVALLRHAVGQLAVVIERLEEGADKSAQPGVGNQSGGKQ